MGDAASPAPESKGAKIRKTLLALGGRVGGVASSVGGTVVSAAGTVATAAKSASSVVVPGRAGLAHADFAHVKSVNQLAREERGRDKDKKYSAADWADAERRADEVLSKLWEGYFEESCDPVAHELQQLTTEAGPDEIDVVVDRLTTGVEKVSGKLARHVFKKRDQLLDGITTVTAVEDDLKAAFMIARSSRASLRQSGEEIMRNMRVVVQTRRKRHCLELLEVLQKVHRTRSLQQSLKRAQELGEYGEAVLLCFESFHSLESLQQLKVAGELRASVQRLYVDLLLRVDAALTAICAEFEPARYSKVLEAYMLQGISGQELSEKVLQAFVDAACDVTSRTVRALLLTKHSVIDRLAAGGSLEGNYASLCSSLPAELIRPCLAKQMQVLFDILASYHVMARWHLEYLEQQQQQQQQGSEADADTPQSQAQAQAKTIYGFLSSVAQALSSSRSELFDLVILRVTELLNLPDTFTGDNFVQVVTWERRFIAAGEAFMGAPATELRSALAETSGELFTSCHQRNMENLNTLLYNERWRHVEQPGLEPSIQLAEAITHSPAYTPGYGELGAQSCFDDWMAQGNPFAGVGEPSARVTPRKSKADKQAAAEVLWGSPVLATTSATPATPGRAQQQDQQQQGGWGTPTTSTAASAGRATSSSSPASASAHFDSQTLSAAAAAAAAASTAAAAATAGATAGGSGRYSGSSEVSTSGAGEAGVSGGSGHTITVSSGHALKCLRAYGQLIKPLSAHSIAIFRSMAELFDHNLLSCFILFGGVTLETLVFQDDLMPTRLKAALLRILTAPNSRYKAAVEELQRMKPLMSGRPPASTTPSSGISFLDRFATKMESLATDLERSVAGMQQRLNDSMQSIQMPAAITSIAGELASAVDRVNALAGSSASGNLYGLHERIAATESLMHMAAELKAGKAALLEALPAGARREAEAFFSAHGSVEAAQDLRHALMRGAARKLLAGLLDEDRGTAQQIATTNYALREPLTSASPWAMHAVRCYGQFRELISSARLPESIVLQVWEYAVLTGADAIVDGLSRVRRCTFEGRASMSFDLSHLERAIRALAPPGFSGSFRSADAYIKAFYLPWEELSRWCQVHFAEYGKYRIGALVQLVCDAYQVSRQQRQDMLSRIEQMSKEFAQS